MNFKPLENEMQYEYTKQRVKELDRQIEYLKKYYPKTDEFYFFASSVFHAKGILQAEIDDYERRRKCNLNNRQSKS